MGEVADVIEPRTVGGIPEASGRALHDLEVRGPRKRIGDADSLPGILAFVRRVEAQTEGQLELGHGCVDVGHDHPDVKVAVGEESALRRWRRHSAGSYQSDGRYRDGSTGGVDALIRALRRATALGRSEQPSGSGQRS